jgi:hypothetical protein
VSQLHEQLDELVATRDQMEKLVRVIVEIGSDLELDVSIEPDAAGTTVHLFARIT